MLHSELENGGVTKEPPPYWLGKRSPRARAQLPWPLDAVTYGGGGGTAYSAALEQAGAVGRYFVVGAAYKF